MIDFLHAVDWIVDNPRSCAEQVALCLHLPPMVESWTNRFDSHHYEATFLKAGDDLIQAPTRLEFIRATGPVSGTDRCSVAPIRQITRLQGARVQKTHATVLCVDDFDEYTEWLRSAGTDVWLEDPCEHLSQPRGWIGWTLDGRRREPPFDSGLFLEYLPTRVLGRRLSTAIPDAEPSPTPRVTRRVHLVEDLDGTLRALEGKARLTPSGPVTVDRVLSARIARFTWTSGTGAALELAEPVGGGAAGDYWAQWGGGPWFTGVAVHDAGSVNEAAIDRGAIQVGGGGHPLLSIGPGLLFEVTDVNA